ncbi:hypothetical protein [Psychromonas sp. SP041]|uniref:hypothetical protein n=1 Tax=Psychromonas sp. SP041 TaxID=1365007 RepID=UPI00040D4BAB|nr:hypothetical protein [Psychromonas sp. SP041]
MAMNGSTWRDHPFEIGKAYIALADNPDFTKGYICSGHQYELINIGYSHYDGASVFTFKCLSTYELVSWWWFDNASDNSSIETFKPLSNKRQ